MTQNVISISCFLKFGWNDGCGRCTGTSAFEVATVFLPLPNVAVEIVEKGQILSGELEGGPYAPDTTIITSHAFDLGDGHILVAIIACLALRWHDFVNHGMFFLSWPWSHCIVPMRRWYVQRQQ